MQQQSQPAPDHVVGGGLSRYRALVAYDGTNYHGWAAQPGLPTVEQELSRAVARILRLPAVRLTCAGRTDAGVHARGQVIHFDAATSLAPARLRAGVNAVLPLDIRVLRVDAAPAAFDARFAALWRRYRYRITDGMPDPLLRHMVVAVRRQLDVAAMDEAVSVLVGEHDFGSFCKPRSGATTIRGLQQVSWSRQRDGLVVLDIRADAFCHSMVRSIVGASLEVGLGRRSRSWLGELLVAPSRQTAAPVAPAHGLVLEEVAYPDDADLAAAAASARRLRHP